MRKNLHAQKPQKNIGKIQRSSIPARKISHKPRKAETPSSRYPNKSNYNSNSNAEKNLNLTKKHYLIARKNVQPFQQITKSQLEKLTTFSQQNQNQPDFPAKKITKLKRPENKNQLNSRIQNIERLFPRESLIEETCGKILWIHNYNKETGLYRAYFYDEPDQPIEDDLPPLCENEFRWMISLFNNGITLKNYKPSPKEEIDIGVPNEGYFYVSEIIADYPATNDTPQLFFTRYRGETLSSAEWLSEFDFSSDSDLLKNYLEKKRRKTKGEFSIPISRAIYADTNKSSAKSNFRDKTIKDNITPKTIHLDLNAYSKTQKTKRRRNSNRGRGRKKSPDIALFKHYSLIKLKRKRQNGQRPDCIRRAINSQLECGLINSLQGRDLTSSSRNWTTFSKKLKEIGIKNNLGNLDIIFHEQDISGKSIGILGNFLKKYRGLLKKGVHYIAYKKVGIMKGHCVAINSGIAHFDKYSSIVDDVDQDLCDFALFTFDKAEFCKKTDGNDIDEILSVIFNEDK